MNFPDHLRGVEEEPDMRADARRNYDKLVEAARKVFAAHGGGASMEAIAKEAGVGVGTLYRHFPKRIDLVEALWLSDVEELVAIADRVAEALEPWPALVAWLEAYVMYARAKRVFLNELHEAFDKNPNLKVESRERMTVALGRVLERAQHAGVARSDVDGSDVMQLVSSMCMAATLEEGQASRMLAMIVDGVRPSPTTGQQAAAVS